jgi:copper(I)-binding protein
MPVALIAVQADGTTTLKTGGGYNITIGHSRHPLHAGERFPLRSHFRRPGWVSVTCTVVPH